jgi:chemotaxis protein CheC
MSPLGTANATPTVDWHRMFEPATESASTAMQAWTHGQVSLSLNEVQELPLECVSEALALGDAMSLMVLVDVTGVFGGQLILQFDEDSSRELVACLLGRSVKPIDAWGKLEMSALAETGNILASAYLNRITLLTGHRVLPSAPSVVSDYAACVLQSAIITQALQGEQILLCRTQFRMHGEPIAWNVFFVPSLELLNMLRDCAGSTPDNNP